MDHAEIAKRMVREREFWIDVAPGKRVRVLRPMVDEAHQFVGGVNLEPLCRYLRGWDGIVESDLIAGGSTEPVEFSLDIASMKLRDDIGWARRIAKAFGDAIDARSVATEAAEKNSGTS